MKKEKPKKKRKARKPSTWKSCEWQSLLKGDVIKSVVGHGPYTVNMDGTKDYMGHYGLFRVHSVDDKGVHAYDKDCGGHCYIIMVNGFGAEGTGIIRQPHKLLKKVVIVND